MNYFFLLFDKKEKSELHYQIVYSNRSDFRELSTGIVYKTEKALV